MMGAVNVLQLILLVWTFTAVCEADDDPFSITCENVTGGVGEKLNLTCTVSYSKKNECSMKMYKFINTAAEVFDPKICKVLFETDLFTQENKISCPYTANKAMTTKFQLFLQTDCGAKRSEFSVKTTAVATKVAAQLDGGPSKETSVQTDSSSKRVHLAVIPVIIGLIVIMGIILKLKKKPNFPSGFQMGLFINNNSEHSDETG
ncbi:uncharacterized protein [Paramisgurnus dabryanus]|uniref:uncharacterized protein isoform X2 n=1 Tax=Paramisgurnus dabryanus TaxID=90735 RepID=UPI003CCF223F